MTPRHQGLAREAAEQIASRKQSRRWSILGLAGSGKSRFVAEVGSQLHETGTDIIFATAVGDESSARRHPSSARRRNPRGLTVLS